MDRLWDPVETSLRDLARRLAARRLQAGDDRLLFDYVATAGVRHPSFEAIAADYQARQSLPALQGDDLQYARVLALGNQRPVMPTWRWRVLHSPGDAPRFMLTDRGWMYVGMEDWATHGLLLLMGPRVAILGYLDDPGLPPARPPFEEHLDLCPSTVTWINAAAWADPYINLLIAHPDDRDRLAGVAHSWIYTLLDRYRAEGDAAFEPRPRRPKNSPSVTAPGTVELITRLRKELAGQGLDAGPQTIASSTTTR